MSQDQTPSSQQSQSAAWFYYTADNQRIGPITAAQLKQLAAMGHITPETIIENVGGRREKAGNVRGLTFATTVPTPQPGVASTPKKSSPPASTTLVALPTPSTKKASRPTPESRASVFRFGNTIALVLTVLVVSMGFGFGWRYFAPSSKEVTATYSVPPVPVQQPQAQMQPVTVPPVTASVPTLASQTQPSQLTIPANRKTMILVNSLTWGTPAHGANYSLWVNGEKIDSTDKSGNEAGHHLFELVELPDGEVTVEGRVGFKNGYGQIMGERRVRGIILVSDMNLPAVLELSLDPVLDTHTVRGVEALVKAAEERKRLDEVARKVREEHRLKDEEERKVLEDRKKATEERFAAEEAARKARSPAIRITLPWSKVELDKNSVYYQNYSLLIDGKEYKYVPSYSSDGIRPRDGSFDGNFGNIYLPEAITNLEGRVELTTIDGKMVAARSVTTTIDTTKEIPKTIELKVSKEAPTKKQPTHTVIVQ